MSLTLMHVVDVLEDEEGFSVRFVEKRGSKYAFSDWEDFGVITEGPPDYYSWDVLEHHERSFDNRGHYKFLK